jgi:hypothetical protein
VSLLTSKLDDALGRMTSAFEILKHDEPDEDLAVLAAQLGRLHFSRGISMRPPTPSNWRSGSQSRSGSRDDLGSDEHEGPDRKFPRATRGSARVDPPQPRDRPRERHAERRLRAYANLSNEMYERDRYDESTRLDLDAIAMARRLGWSGPEWFARMQIVGHQVLSGAWDDVLDTMREAMESDDPGVRAGLEGIAWEAMEVARNRGEVGEVNRYFAIWQDHSDSDDVQARAIYAVVRATAAEARGDRQQAHGFAGRRSRCAARSAGDTGPSSGRIPSPSTQPSS